MNHNYTKFINEFEKLTRDAVIIANYRGEGKPIGSLNILKYYSVGDDCVEFWGKKGISLVSKIIDEFGNRENLFYVVSAGPMSGPIIAELYRNNPNNCYIDFGSAIDTYIHNKVTRPYMRDRTLYSQKECWMYNPKLRGLKSRSFAICVIDLIIDKCKLLQLKRLIVSKRDY